MFSRKLEQNEESRKISKDDLESGVKFITDEIKPDIDAMAVQIFTDLPEENPFQLSDTAPEQVLIHQQTEPVYQQLTIDPHSGVAQALEGNWVVPENIHTPSTEGFFVSTPPPPPNPSGNSSFVSYFLLNILVFEIPLPLGISNDPPQGGYGYFLELHKGIARGGPGVPMTPIL